MLEFIERNVEFYIQILVAVNIDGFNEVGNKHFLGIEAQHHFHQRFFVSPFCAEMWLMPHSLSAQTAMMIKNKYKAAWEGDKNMSTMIICVGKAMLPAAGKYDAAAFDAAIRDIYSSACPPYEGKKFNAEGKTVLIGEGLPAQDTAEKTLLPCEWAVDSLLNEIPLRSFEDTQRCFTERQWAKKAAAQRKRGDARQSESEAAVQARADKVIEKLSGADHILVTYPAFLKVLLNRLRVHGFVVQRTGFMSIQPYEWFLVSRKEAHCGGCQHNCFLSNPGCGAGRDKAMRLGLPYSERTPGSD